MDSQMSLYKAMGMTVMLRTQGHTISEVLEGFENVLRGQGYVFDGRLDIVEEES